MLGTAAVVSIYAAGFARTRAAALRLEEEEAAHQRPTLVLRPPPPPAPPADSAPATSPATSPPTDAPEAVVAARVARATPRPRAPVARTEDSASVPAVAPATVVDTARAAAPTPAPVTPPAESVPVDTATAPAKPAWRDGTYTGWGDSRHGSIEATVTIRAGRITDAYISRCLTRYSCSWIEHLQIQVVDRQGPEVDFVSGATQSVNAFYYAVVQALGRAKGP